MQGCKTNEIYCLIVLGARSLKSWCQQDHTPSESCRRTLPCLFQFLVVFCQLWEFLSLYLHTPISAFIITWCFPCLCLHKAIFLCKHQSYWIKSPPYSIMTLFNLTMTLFPNKMTLCSTVSCCYSVVKSCLTLYDPTDCSAPGFPVLTISWSLLKLKSTEPVMPSNYLILCRLLILLRARTSLYLLGGT